MQAYLAAILVSLILFGSVARGGFSESSSDVDLFLVLPDGASPEDRCWLRDTVTSVEIRHGLREPSSRSGLLETVFERATANDCSLFICTRADLLSGSIARMLNIRSALARFVDRIVIPGILASVVTLQGEALHSRAPVALIRRFDVFKAFFALFCQVLGSAVVTALKRSVHSY